MIHSFSNYAKRNGIISLILACAVLPKILGPVTNLSFIYEPLVIVFFLLNLFSAKKVDFSTVTFLIIAVLSIILSDALPVFKPWLRFSYFILLLGAVGPLFNSHKIHILKEEAFKWVLLFCSSIGVLSFIAMFMGINYMNASPDLNAFTSSGSFGGFAPHSMTLSSVSAIGALYIVYLMLIEHVRKSRLNKFLLSACMMCVCSMLISASRGAFLSFSVALFCMLLEISRNKVKVVFFACFLAAIAIIVSVFTEYNIFYNLLDKHQNNMDGGGIFMSRSALWQDRWTEFVSSPVLGVGFCCQIIISNAFTLRTGVIEPGSSYLACLSSTGIAGFLGFILILFSAYRKRLKNDNLLGMPVIQKYIFIYYIIHISIEGYMFSAGSESAFIAWLCIGTMHASPRFLTNLNSSSNIA